MAQIFFTRWISLLPNQQCRVTEKTKLILSSNLASSFFHHCTPGGSSVAPFTMTDSSMVS